jgi:hypothetical protein
MSSRMTDAERRAFNDGLQAALFAICIGKVQDFPLCTDLDDDVCQGCNNLLKKQKQLCTRIKALHYGRPEHSKLGNLAKDTI